jgi:hypothetical protein
VTHIIMQDVWGNGSASVFRLSVVIMLTVIILFSILAATEVLASNDTSCI